MGRFRRRAARVAASPRQVLMERYTGLLGILAILASAYLFSTNRRAIKPRVIIWGLGLQFTFAFLVLKTDVGEIFQALSAASTPCSTIPRRAASSSSGQLGVKPTRSAWSSRFRCCPSSSSSRPLFAILYYLGVMQ